jgi:hypothetical protein
MQWRLTDSGKCKNGEMPSRRRCCFPPATRRRKVPAPVRTQPNVDDYSVDGTHSLPAIDWGAACKALRPRALMLRRPSAGSLRVTTAVRLHNQKRALGVHRSGLMIPRRAKRSMPHASARGCVPRRPREPTRHRSPHCDRHASLAECAAEPAMVRAVLLRP